MPEEDDIEMVSFVGAPNIGTLRGHYSPVNACLYRRNFEELYSAGSDRNLLIWVPKTDQNEMFIHEQAGGKKNWEKLMEDSWSDDDG